MQPPAAFIERLRALCAIDSPTGDVDGLDRCARLLAGWCAAAGCEIELLEHRAGLHLIARLRGGRESRTLLVGHHDTVFPAGTARLRPLRTEGDRLLGPGAADMKGGLLVALAALEELAALPAAARGTIELHSVPDEETRLVPPATLDRMRGADASLVFECGREGGELVSARKAGTWLSLTASGRAAHAGTEPERGRSALSAICREALRAEALSGVRPGVTVVATELHGGEVKNTVPDHARLTVDVRAETTADIDWAIAEVGRTAAHDGVVVTATDDRGFPPMTRAPALVEAALELLAALGQPAGEAVAGGVSDGSWTSHVGIPTLDGLGPVGGLDHTEHEYVEPASVGPRVATVVALCRRVGHASHAAVDGPPAG